LSDEAFAQRGAPAAPQPKVAPLACAFASAASTRKVVSLVQQIFKTETERDCLDLWDSGAAFNLHVFDGEVVGRRVEATEHGDGLNLSNVEGFNFVVGGIRGDVIFLDFDAASRSSQGAPHLDGQIRGPSFRRLDLDHVFDLAQQIKRGRVAMVFLRRGRLDLDFILRRVQSARDGPIVFIIVREVGVGLSGDRIRIDQRGRGKSLFGNVDEVEGDITSGTSSLPLDEGMVVTDE